MNTHLALCLCALALPVNAASGVPRRGGLPPDGGAAALAPSQPGAPAGFDVARPGIARGNVAPFEYRSKRDGETFRATIHTPPGFSPAKKHPALYLLHGASGDENSWVQTLRADAILDNLYADEKLVPMLVVMPSCLSVAARDRAGDSRDAKARAAMAFGDVLLRDLIPFVESRYPALADREHRALAGLSMGAGLALQTGLANPGAFAWVGAFSGGNARRLVVDPRLEAASSGRRLLWLSVGDRDNLMGDGMVAAAAFLAERGIPHLFRINAGGHEPKVWMNDLYHFAPMLFRESKETAARARQTP